MSHATPRRAAVEWCSASHHTAPLPLSGFNRLGCYQAMPEFFGKAGMPWHGTMVIRRPRARPPGPVQPGQSTFAAGEFECYYYDAMMNDKKEDGFSTFSAVRLAIEKFKSKNSDITKVYLKTDGAGAYSGIEFTSGLSYMAELTGVRVVAHFIGEVSQNYMWLERESRRTRVAT